MEEFNFQKIKCFHCLPFICKKNKKHIDLEGIVFCYKVEMRKAVANSIYETCKEYWKSCRGKEN